MKDLNWKFARSSLGKEILKPEDRKARLKKESYLNKLAKKLKQTDWGMQPVFLMFQRNGRWIHET